MNLPRPLEAFFFRRISATGFGLMRMAWAFFTGAYLLMQWKDVTTYYSDAGLMTDAIEAMYVRSDWRFTVLEWISTPNAVFTLYLFLLVCLFCMMIGLWPRLMTILSVVLLFSFHEFNPFVLGGGDTLLRNIGFILMIAPGIETLSFSRLEAQWNYWKENRSFLPQVTMPVWPWRLLLWQMIVLYGTSLWYKMLGEMWIDGTAVEAAFHHPVFARWPMWFMNLMMPAAGAGDYLALLWQGMWLLFLIPAWFIDLAWPKHFPRLAFRRCMLAGGVLFHGGIFVMMDAGIFSLAVYTAFLGLLREEDFKWMAKTLNNFSVRRKSIPITLLYDGHCGLCLRSVFTLTMLDVLKRLRYADFRDKAVRTKEAPEITIETLDKAMHIRKPGGTYQTGFDAFRHMTWHLPPLWIVAPFLYFPGVAPVGRRIYARIAANRRKCDHEGCAL